VEKIHLQRYNPQTKEIEYLTQHKGFEIHQSIWLTKSALVGAGNVIAQFQKYWKGVCESQNKILPDSTSFSIGQNLWVKLRGHPWWPARVVQCKKLTHNRHDYVVTFYGDNTFGLVNDYSPQDFSLDSFVEPEKHKKSNNAEAVQQAVDLVPEPPSVSDDSEI